MIIACSRLDNNPVRTFLQIWNNLCVFTCVRCKFFVTCVDNAPFRCTGGPNLMCKEVCKFFTGWCMREPCCPLSSAVCNATIPTLPLFEMTESACSTFYYVLHYLLFIKFMLVFYHVCVTGQLL